MYDHLWCRARVFDSKVIEISELLCDTAESDWTDDKKKELIFRARVSGVRVDLVAVEEFDP